ncbi:MAG TPA: hypothetical protein VIS99_08260, partial [Terrimicrobiaceae bacterium]
MRRNPGATLVAVSNGEQVSLCPFRGEAARISFLALAFLFVMAVSSHAQVQVDVTLKRSLYMLYEPLICAVTITNLSGGTLTL